MPAQLERSRLPYFTKVIRRPRVAENITVVVNQPRMFMARVFTQRPMIFLLLVINITISIRNGVDTPWAIPAKTSALMGLMGRKFNAMATTVKTLTVVQNGLARFH